MLLRYKAHRYVSTDVRGRTRYAELLLDSTANIRQLHDLRLGFLPDLAAMSLIPRYAGRFTFLLRTRLWKRTASAYRKLAVNVAVGLIEGHLPQCAVR